MFTGAGGEKLPADIALAIIPSLPRAQLEHLVQRLVDRLDEEDGDPDVEDALDTEDDVLTDFARQAGNDGPGCRIADSDFAVDDLPCDDPDADKEREERFVPLYGSDQSAGIIAWRVR
jgi:hypothetical protein